MIFVYLAGIGAVVSSCCEGPLLPAPQELANPTFDQGLASWDQIPGHNNEEFSYWMELSDSSVHAYGGWPDSKYLVQSGAWHRNTYEASITGTNHTDHPLYLRYVGVKDGTVTILHQETIPRGRFEGVRYSLRPARVTLEQAYDAIGIQVGFIQATDDILSFNLTKVTFIALP